MRSTLLPAALTLLFAACAVWPGERAAVPAEATATGVAESAPSAGVTPATMCADLSLASEGRDVLVSGDCDGAVIVSRRAIGGDGEPVESTADLPFRDTAPVAGVYAYSVLLPDDPGTRLAELYIDVGDAGADPATEAETRPVAPSATGTRAAVAADHPLASQTGIDILQAGGNAVDAAVAVGLVLGVVNPFGSGIGGGGFAVYSDASGAERVALDFRETAPSGATRDMYVEDGTVVSGLSTRGGLAVAVPGEIAGWWALHQRFGALDWQSVVEPALRLARDGFESGSLLPERLASAIQRGHTAVPGAFTSDGELEAGSIVTRPQLASTLNAVATGGAEAFYEGDVAHAIAEEVREAGGIITTEDLASYAVRWLEPIRTEYQGYEVLGMPPPSSGGVAIGEALRAIELHHERNTEFVINPDDAASAHLIVETLAHVFADRARLLGDPDFFDVPVSELLSDERAAEICDAFEDANTLTPGAYGPVMEPPEDGGTSHFSIIDGDGNAIAVTSTVNTSFGSGVVGSTTGIIYNNEMDDFSAQPGSPNAYGLVGSEANAIAPGKRPLSSMSPTIVLRDGAPVASLGGSGGPKIITSTLLVLLRVIDQNLTLAEAVAAPRLHHQWLPFVLFSESPAGSDLRAGLVSRGHDLRDYGWASAVQAVWRAGGRIEAASDYRKHGAPAVW